MSDLKKSVRTVDRLLTKAWKHSNFGKVAVILSGLLAFLPLVVEAYALYAIRDWIFNLPSGVVDRIAVLSFVLGSLGFIGWWFTIFLGSLMVDMVKK